MQDVRSTCQGPGLGLHIEVFNVSKTATTGYKNQKEDIDTQYSSLKMSLSRGKENLKFWLLTPTKQSCGCAVVGESIVKHKTHGRFLVAGPADTDTVAGDGKFPTSYLKQGHRPSKCNPRKQQI